MREHGFRYQLDPEVFAGDGGLASLAEPVVAPGQRHDEQYVAALVHHRIWHQGCYGCLVVAAAAAVAVAVAEDTVQHSHYCGLHVSAEDCAARAKMMQRTKRAGTCRMSQKNAKKHVEELTSGPKTRITTPRIPTAAAERDA